MSRFFLSSLIVFSLAINFGCAMKSPQTQPASQTLQQDTSPTTSEESLRGSEGKIVEEAITPVQQSTISVEPLTPLERPSLAGLQIVPFAYDQHLLSEEARNIIATNAEILKPLPRIKFQLAGHTDERGSDQYNIALGERRGEAVRSYLIELGIAPGRMETVSYGEEQPLDAGHDESAWQKNRRVEFILLP